MKNQPKTEYIAIGKDFLSIERAKQRAEKLEENGYICIKNTGKRMTFVKR